MINTVLDLQKWLRKINDDPDCPYNLKVRLGGMSIRLTISTFVGDDEKEYSIFYRSDQSGWLTLVEDIEVQSKLRY